MTRGDDIDTDVDYQQAIACGPATTGGARLRFALNVGFRCAPAYEPPSQRGHPTSRTSFRQSIRHVVRTR